MSGRIQINLKTQALFSIAYSFHRAIYIQEAVKKEQEYCSASKAISLMSYPRSF